ncbi:MAG: methyltransferase [Tagaea sp. CACIAM 22H2]|nr:methyltransferase [Tagaea sp. CACIAM 22H2]
MTINAATAGTGFSGLWRHWRNALLGDSRFRRFAARFAPTRAIARREAKAVFDLCAGFVYSQILYASLRTGLLDLLASAPRSIADVAAMTDLSPSSAARLCDAARVLGLADQLGDGRYVLGPRGAVIQSDAAIRAMIEHHAMFYRDLADPVALLRDPTKTGELGAFWRYAGGQTPDAGAAADYSKLMSGSIDLVANEILDAYPFQRHRHLMDVGGGEGAFVAAVAARHRGLSLTLVDLPAVAARAESKLAKIDSIRVVGADFRRESLPTGADIVTLVRVLHDHDDDVALALLRKIHAALPEGGTVVIGEPMADAASAETVGAAYFGFYFLAMGQGRARRAGEIEALLSQAGFKNARRHPTALPLQVGVVSATARTRV